MKSLKRLAIFLMIPFIVSCNKESKKTLYQQQLNNLLSRHYEVSNNLPFDISGTTTLYEGKNRIQLTFANPIRKLSDFTIMVLDQRITDAKDAPINVGFFNNQNFDFVPNKEDSNDQIAFRFTFYSDITNPSFKIATSYLENNIREEVYFHYTIE